MKIVNDDSRVVNKLEASLTDDNGVIIYDRHMFIAQATDVPTFKVFFVFGRAFLLRAALKKLRKLFILYNKN
jgi:hypothetical protein